MTYRTLLNVCVQKICLHALRAQKNFKQSDDSFASPITSNWNFETFSSFNCTGFVRSCLREHQTLLSTCLQACNAEHVAWKRRLGGSSLERCWPRRWYCFRSQYLYYWYLPRHFPQIRWCGAHSESFLLLSSPVIPPNWTPTQPSHRSERSGMWPCMSYMRLICLLTGNVLFSRSQGEERFKRRSEIRFSFVSIFPLLTEE